MVKHNRVSQHNYPESLPRRDRLSTKRLAFIQPRGVTEKSVLTTLTYGEKRHWYHGAQIYYLSNRNMNAALAMEPDLRHCQGR